MDDINSRANAHIRQNSRVIAAISGFSGIGSDDARAIEWVLIETIGRKIKETSTLSNIINIISENNKKRYGYDKFSNPILEK
ncbi:hypothetical protein LV564_18465 (plasmid) [Komagataeibacter nataicola]|uniref:Transposase n=1 Tax=Komagataeibacter melomenusus TaxID=2766578 RepID=A0ABX2ACX1_9PROT|nr:MULTISPECIES: hypothetical protein [Komagataeibacter]MBV0889125.1 hypothetical protein [Komagataeibacter oboediens]MBV1830231.1 hypothetical protein [Komagataeibacter melomenusus]MCK9821192.1 hypothetical protein [Komagataeibacter oboediens]NPC65679.1 hypothetical protein [Komagataeibacter melomenusus]WEQ57553.1 hypothetical protein LV564_18465 [Komagataeibacter nataicola]